MEPLGQRILRTMAVDEFRKVSTVCKKLRVTRKEVEEAVEETSGLDLVVGFRTGVGYAERAKSAWEIERYE